MIRIFDKEEREEKIEGLRVNFRNGDIDEKAFREGLRQLGLYDQQIDEEVQDNS